MQGQSRLSCRDRTFGLASLHNLYIGPFFISWQVHCLFQCCKSGLGRVTVYEDQALHEAVPAEEARCRCGVVADAERTFESAAKDSANEHKTAGGKAGVSRASSPWTVASIINPR